MAFVKLRNIYGKEIKIPAGAEKSYRNLGFYPVEEFVKNADTTGEETDGTANDETGTDEDDFEVPENGEGKSENDSEKSDDEIFVETVSKKPLASWSKDEVKRYSAIYNIDLTGTKNVNDAKERIKAFMSDAE